MERGVRGELAKEKTPDGEPVLVKLLRWVILRGDGVLFDPVSVTGLTLVLSVCFGDEEMILAPCGSTSTVQS